jgi:hypothetical protein
MQPAIAGVLVERVKVRVKVGRAPAAAANRLDGDDLQAA